MAKKQTVSNKELALQNLQVAKESLEKEYAEHPQQTVYTIIVSLELEIRNLLKLLEK
jgi:hypothetical protein